jgi:hypothetical protein
MLTYFFFRPKKILRQKDGTAAANDEPQKLNYGAEPSTVVSSPLFLFLFPPPFSPSETLLNPL